MELHGYIRVGINRTNPFEQFFKKLILDGINLKILGDILFELSLQDFFWKNLTSDLDLEVKESKLGAWERGLVTDNPSSHSTFRNSGNHKLPSSLSVMRSTVIMWYFEVFKI